MGETAAAEKRKIHHSGRQTARLFNHFPGWRTLHMSIALHPVLPGNAIAKRRRALRADEGNQQAEYALMADIQQVLAIAKRVESRDRKKALYAPGKSNPLAIGRNTFTSQYTGRHIAFGIFMGSRGDGAFPSRQVHLIKLR